MNIGTLFRARAVKNVFGGDSICRVAGEVVFTPGVIAGEYFIGRITRKNRDYARAELVEIITASPDRVHCSCPGMGRCPGCVYGFMSHEAEQRTKLQQLQEFLKPLDVAPELVQGCGLENAPEAFYRNKIKLTMRKSGGEAQLGYVFPDGRMYPLQQCNLASPAINRKLAELLQDPGFIPTVHDRMSVTLRESADGVCYFRNQAGKRMGMLREKVLGRDFVVPPEGFFQVNNYGMDVLTKLIQSVLQSMNCQYFIDAYAGSGLFGAVAAASGVGKISGVESDELSAMAARRNYQAFGAKDFTFYSGDAGELLPELLNAAPEDALVLFDPPRGGLDSRAVRALNNCQLRNAIYVSCHPATLVRDLARLQRGNFQIKQVRLIDMFPRSTHFETFVQLSR